MKRILLVAALFVLATIGVVRAGTDEPYGPTIVARGGGTNLTSSIGTTTLFTPTSDGFFAVNAYVLNRSGAGCSDQDIITWTDTGGTTHNYGPGIASRAPTGWLTFYAAAGTPIQYAVTQGSCTYDYALVLEKQ